MGRLEREQAEYHAIMARSWDLLAERAMEDDAWEIPEIRHAAERLARQAAISEASLRRWRQWLGVPIPTGPPEPHCPHPA